MHPESPDVLTPGPPAVTIAATVSASASQPGPRPTTADAVRYDQLYADHAGRVRAYLHRCGFAPADVDDLAQDVFLRAFRSLHTFDAARGTAGQWLGAIVRNVARRQWSRRANAQTIDPELAEAVLADDGPAAEAPETREELAALRQCIAVLPPDLGRIVRLRYVDGLTTRGIGNAERLPEATVRLRLDDARAALTRCLKSKGVW
jgi:RNA polymerase sigma-70 factor, ECF subfamily